MKKSFILLMLLAALTASGKVVPGCLTQNDVSFTETGAHYPDDTQTIYQAGYAGGLFDASFRSLNFLNY